MHELLKPNDLYSIWQHQIENLKENQTSVLNFGGGIAGLIITGLLTYNAYLFEYIGDDIKFSNQTTFMSINYIFAAVTLLIWTMFICRLWLEKTERINSLVENYLENHNINPGSKN